MLFDRIASRLLNVEGGLLHTACRLTVAPGRVVRDYLGGRTVPYTDPFSYVLIAVSAWALVFVLADGVGGTGSDNQIFTVLIVPCVAAVSRLLFWREPLTYPEHLIVAMYVLGHGALLGAVLMFAAPLLKPAVATHQMVGLLYAGAILLANVAYVVWSYSRIFADRPVLASLRAIVALTAGTALWAGGVLAIIALLSR